MISAGFRNLDANNLLKQIKGFKKQKEVWSCFDPRGRNLPGIVGNHHWQYVNNAVKMRNNLVHGSRVYPLSDCKEVAEQILSLLDQIVVSFNLEYGFNGWSRVSIRRKSTLHTDPKVRL